MAGVFNCTRKSKNNSMRESLLRDFVDICDYVSPNCQVISVGSERVICVSETEMVDEENGEW